MLRLHPWAFRRLRHAPHPPSLSAGLNEEPLTALAPARSDSAGGDLLSSNPSVQVEYLSVQPQSWITHIQLTTQPRSTSFLILDPHVPAAGWNYALPRLLDHRISAPLELIGRSVQNNCLETLQWIRMTYLQCDMRRVSRE